VAPAAWLLIVEPKPTSLYPRNVWRAATDHARCAEVSYGRSYPPRRILDTVTEPEAVRRFFGRVGFAAQPPPGWPVPAL
jgi:hypothetical protein